MVLLILSITKKGTINLCHFIKLFLNNNKKKIMKKISTFFKKDPNDLGRVINEINPENAWVLDANVTVATRKFDGTSCAIINGELYKRYDAKFKNGKYTRKIPEGAIPCSPLDEKSGHHPHWIKVDFNDPANKWHKVGYYHTIEKFLIPRLEDGTYELCGEKIQGNPEKLQYTQLIRHGSEKIIIQDYSFEGIKKLLTELDVEGIVFHNKETGEMCKIRKTDFGIKR